MIKLTEEEVMTDIGQEKGPEKSLEIGHLEKNLGIGHPETCQLIGLIGQLEKNLGIGAPRDESRNRPSNERGEGRLDNRYNDPGYGGHR